jgi:putative tryptophan/tyrosine transport system substrate-binding protein
MNNAVSRKVICPTFCALLLALWVSAEAQPTGRVYRVGYLAVGTVKGSHEEAFQQALRNLGYVEGQNVVIEWRHAGQQDRFPTLAADLVRLKVDCIVTVGVRATRAAKQASGTIPIVMGDADDDPVRQGLITSLARPGGNVTGVISISSDLAGKRLELLKETVPKLSRVAILSVPHTQESAAAGHVKETESAARALGVKLQSLEVRGPGDIDNAFQAARKARAEAFIAVMVGGMRRHLPQILNLAIKNRLPGMYTQSRHVPEGGLMSYATDTDELKRRAAIYVDKILKGTKPADLPVEQPTKFELVINLKSAKQIGLTIPPTVLSRADRVIR